MHGGKVVLMGFQNMGCKTYSAVAIPSRGTVFNGQLWLHAKTSVSMRYCDEYHMGGFSNSHNILSLL